MKKGDFSKAASILYNHRINSTRLNNFPPNLQPSTEEEAYNIQNELKKIYLTMKNNFSIGKKVGCTNQRAQKQVNVNKPFYGNLFSKYSALSGCSLKSNKFSKPYMEPEFSFRIKEDINISKAPYQLSQINKLVDTVMGSIEIVDFRFNNELKDIGINNLIATNGASEYWIKEENEFLLSEIDLSNHPVKVYINNNLIEEGNSSNVLNNPLNSLLWVVNELAIKGEILLKNDIVSTGTCTSAIPLIKGYDIIVDFASLGKVNFKFD